MIKLDELLIENPVIAAIRNNDDFKDVMESNVKIVFVLYGTILNICDICRSLKESNKIVFVHVDLIEGLRGDMSGMEFIKKGADCEGIITTKTNIIKHAKQFSLKTILRVFILDSLSLKTGIKNINETKPDAVELLPGIICGKVEELGQKIDSPIIAGGLIVKKKEIIDCLSAGAVAISTSTKKLWSL